jgi:hypothetical protein
MMFDGIRNELRGVQSSIILAERNLDNNFKKVLKTLVLGEVY